MPFEFSRRKIVRRLASAIALAAVPVSEAVGRKAVAPPRLGQEGADEPALRRVINGLRSTIGASLVGFGRRDPGAVGRTVQDKLLEWPTITDFGALADDHTDNTPIIQHAIDVLYAAGGGTLCIPVGTFRITSCVLLRSGITLKGMGRSSVLHCVNNRRSDALRGEGRADARLTRIELRDFAILGDVEFAGGKPSVVNGGGVSLIHADDCSVSGVSVVGFSDGGIAFLNGNRNSVSNCYVERTAQGISFNASDISVSGNIAVGNRIFDTGEYNGLHLEGGFGGKTNGEVRHTTLSGNSVSGAWEAGINIELAPYTACVGNTVDRAGLGYSSINMGIKVYGGYRSVVCGNTVIGCSGNGIVIGANSGECAIDSNVTAGNGGSLLLTDSGAQVSNDVAIGSNSFTEADIRFEGNVRLRNRTFGLSFANHSSADPNTLDWYEEGHFVLHSASHANKWVARHATFTRIGNVVYIVVSIEGAGAFDSYAISFEGLPYPASFDTPMSATGSDAGQAELAHCLAAWARGSTITLSKSMQGEGPAIKKGKSGMRIAIAGHYITTG